MSRAIADRWLGIAHERFSAAGFRIGAARAKVLDVVARDAQCLVGAQDIVAALRSEGGIGSQASVYRVFDKAYRLGLLRRELDESGAVRYEISLPEFHHHHLVDETSGETIPFHDDELEAAIVAAAARLGVRMTGHEVRIRGMVGGLGPTTDQLPAVGP
ncbi:MAG: transcriptional repressor [Actinomycetota bacterium]|nr:transcriptional repressor [Actinomycetota bacterium]